MRGGCARPGPVVALLRWGQTPRVGQGRTPAPPRSPEGRGALWVQSPAGEKVRAWETRSLLLGTGPGGFGTPRSSSALRL